MRRTAGRRWVLWATLTIVPPLMVVALALMLDASPKRDPENGDHFDAIIVLGCRVMPSGAPSLALERRALHAARLYHAGVAPLVITTGGVGDFPPSEADVAASVLEEAGVPASAILREDASTSTQENAAFAKERFGGRRVLLVTDAFHTWRAERVFAQHYEEVVAVGTRSPIPGERAHGALREVLAAAGYWVLGRIEIEPRPRRGTSNPEEPGPALACLKADLEERATLCSRGEYSDRMVDAVALELPRRVQRNTLRGFRQAPNGALIRSHEAG